MLAEDLNVARTVGRLLDHNVAGTVGRLLDKDCMVKPLQMVNDGDLVALVQYMIRT